MNQDSGQALLEYKSMDKEYKGIWLLSTLFLWGAIVLFVLGNTAFFTRGIDLIMTFVGVVVGIPAVVLAVISSVMLWTDFAPRNPKATPVFVAVMVGLSFFLSLFLLKYTFPKSRNYADRLQTTSDGKYEYRLELRRMFQSNALARLYIKDSKGKERTIRLDAPVWEIAGFSVGFDGYPSEPWSFLEPTDREDIYKLTLTRKLDDIVAGLNYEIDIKAKKATRLE